MAESERGAWTPAFPGQRPPFQPGNELAVRHGAFATVKLGARVDELVELIRGVVPGYTEADELAVRLLALCMARIERASEALEGETDPTKFETLQTHERRWATTMRLVLGDLGMTPTSRARLGLDVTRAKVERDRALRDHIDEHYGDGGSSS